MISTFILTTIDASVVTYLVPIHDEERILADNLSYSSYPVASLSFATSSNPKDASVDILVPTRVF